MPSDTSGQHVINLTNSLIGQAINGQVSWGTNAMPGNSNPAWFQGPTNEIGYLGPGLQAFVGDMGAVSVRDAILYYSSLFNRMCRKRIVIYYNNNGALQPILDQTAIGNFVNGVGQAASIGTDPQPGQDIYLANIQNHIQEMYNRWWALAGAPTTEILTNTVCHTSCHSNCHDNRGRR